MTADHRLATVTAADTTTGICTVTVDGVDVDAKAIGVLPAVGDQVWVELRGEHSQDWVITGIHAPPPTAYFEQWDYNGVNIPTNSITTMTPQNLMFLTGDYPSAWSGTTWTAPVAGPYLWTAVAHPLGAASNRAFVRIQTTLAAVLFQSDVIPPGSQTLTASGCEWFNAGQPMQVTFFQLTGAGQVQDGTARVAVAKL